tara:strand:+ start:550 stop:747 length:198 start_codon:yes stop_codon:yes gene_type:complete
MDVKDYAQEWLEDGGYELGYTMRFLPEMGHMSWIIRDRFKAEHYRDYTLRECHIEFIKLTRGEND